MQKRMKSVSAWILVILILLWVFSFIQRITDPSLEVTYSSFVNITKAEQLAAIELKENRVTGILAEGVNLDDQYTKGTAFKIN